jgi:hypothetical protein
LKEYIYAWRNVVVSYERFVETVFSHMMQVYEPVRLGSCSHPPAERHLLDHRRQRLGDWGGKEQFRHRVAQTTPGE